jgi:signal peptidase I
MTHDENEQEGRAFDVTPAKDAPDPKAQERLRVRRWRGFAVLLTLILGPGFGHFILRRVARGSLWLASAWILLVLTPLSGLFLWLSFFGARIAAAIDAKLAPVDPKRLDGVIAVKLGLALFLASAVLFGATRALYLEGFKISSGGMLPTLEVGDHIMVNKLAYRFGEPERGDLIVFINPCRPAFDYAMRVVAVGGDTVEVRCGVLWINGSPAGREPVAGICEHWDIAGPNDWTLSRCRRYRETLGGVSHDIIDRPEPVRDEGNFPADKIPACPETGVELGRIEPSEDTGKPCGPRRHYVVPAGHVFVMGDNRDNSQDSRQWGPVPVDNIRGKVTSIWWSKKPVDQGGIQWGRIGAVR